MTRRGEARGALLVQLRDLQDVEADPARWSRPLHGRSWQALDGIQQIHSAGRHCRTYALICFWGPGVFIHALKSYTPSNFSGPGVLIHATIHKIL